MTALVCLFVVLGWVACCGWLVWWSTGRPADAGEAAVERQSRLVLLPDGHRPPPGLGPLSPSERFLVQESTRGVRELQAYLLEQRAA